MSKISTKKATSDAIAYRGLRSIARAAGLSKPTLAKHLNEIEHRKLDGVVLVTRGALERWLEGHDAKDAA